ncbi:oocyte zinc finger protein XlCOF8.4-like [Hyperolius riggenbachi]|uniref:oocyte zinc finger protein XlCOF8.4-like n=1 Tax=Hyperolius riggenbachi TaxID=752182 RepID=UPI0035A369CA
MEKEEKRKTEKILNFTLEIICLLTGEEYTLVKKASPHHKTLNSDLRVSEGWSRRRNSIVDPPADCRITERNNKMILEITNKIIELLTGEVPIRCEDVTVYFSMEEWQYIEGHKDLYKDAMMEEQLPLTLQDESSDRNSPERCLSPLYSWDSTREDQKIPHHYQGEDLITIKVETSDGKEMYVRVDEQYEEDIPAEISTDDRYIWNNTERHPMMSQYDIEDDDVTTDCAGENLITHDIHSLCDSEELSSDVSAHGGRFPGYSHLRGGELFPCSECGEQIRSISELISHQRAHAAEDANRSHDLKAYACLQCGKCFPWRAFLLRHQRTHTGEKPFSCSMCGKCFGQKSALVRHERIHTGAKPYSCSECGKDFTDKSNLLIHVRTHASRKAFFCSECGESFDHRGNFISHRRTHVTVGPYSCSVCGKYFNFRSLLIRHERSHTGEKPFSCSDCGKCFSWMSALIRHKKIHSMGKPFS